MSTLLLDQLHILGFADDEARLYLELMKQPANHLQLSRITGINRSKVYRLIAGLEKRGLVYRQTDDRGTFLKAAEPSFLESEITAREDALDKQRQALAELQNKTKIIRQSNSSFVVKTYHGSSGIKQMVWNELRAEERLLALGNGSVEDVISDKNWARKHRNRQIASGYKALSIVNDASANDVSPVIIKAGLYECRYLPELVTKFDNQTIIYNNTVAIYYWGEPQKMGVEIINESYATTMRQIFNQYWDLARQIEI